MSYQHVSGSVFDSFKGEGHIEDLKEQLSLGNQLPGAETIEDDTNGFADISLFEDDVETADDVHEDVIFAPQCNTDNPETSLREYQIRKGVNSRSVLGTLRKWENMVAVLSLKGSVRFSVEQYTFFRSVLSVVASMSNPTLPCLPHYKTVQKTLIPAIQYFCFPQPTLAQFRVDLDRAGATVQHPPLEVACQPTMTQTSPC